jgi:hypothetical protein
MKSTKFVAGAGALAVALVTLSAAPASAAPGVVNSTVNLRQGPSTNTPVLAKIPGGAGVDVAGCSGAWCRVSFAGKSGYVIATALGSGAPPPGYGPPPGYAPPAVYYEPPPYYGPYYYGYGPYYGFGGGCCWGGGGGWHGGGHRR